MSLFILLNWQLLTAEIVQYISGEVAFVLSLVVFFQFSLTQSRLIELYSAASNTFRDFHMVIWLESSINGCRHSDLLRVFALARLLVPKLLLHVAHVDFLGAHLVV